MPQPGHAGSAISAGSSNGSTPLRKASGQDADPPTGPALGPSQRTQHQPTRSTPQQNAPHDHVRTATTAQRNYREVRCTYSLTITMSMQPTSALRPKPNATHYGRLGGRSSVLPCPLVVCGVQSCIGDDTKILRRLGLKVNRLGLRRGARPSRNPLRRVSARQTLKDGVEAAHGAASRIKYRRRSLRRFNGWQRCWESMDKKTRPHGAGSGTDKIPRHLRDDKAFSVLVAKSITSLPVSRLSRTDREVGTTRSQASQVGTTNDPQHRRPVLLGDHLLRVTDQG